MSFAPRKNCCGCTVRMRRWSPSDGPTAPHARKTGSAPARGERFSGSAPSAVDARLVPNRDEQDSSRFVGRSSATQTCLASARARGRACRPAHRAGRLFKARSSATQAASRKLGRAVALAGLRIAQSGCLKRVQAPRRLASHQLGRAVALAGLRIAQSGCLKRVQAPRRLPRISSGARSRLPPCNEFHSMQGGIKRHSKKATRSDSGVGAANGVLVRWVSDEFQSPDKTLEIRPREWGV